MNNIGTIYAKCNKSCGHKWHVAHFNKDKLPGGVEKTYFTCPNCQRDYVCFYTDEHVRQLLKKVREIDRQLKWKAGTDEYQTLVSMQISLREEIKKHMNELKAAAIDG